MSILWMILLYTVILVVSVCVAYSLGAGEARQLKKDLATDAAVRHNLNCLVGDLKHEVALSKGKALAFDSLRGQWTTDTPEILRHFPKKEYFRRIGYPGQRL